MARLREPFGPTKRIYSLERAQRAPVAACLLRLGEAADQAGGALGVTVELLEQLVAGQARLERLRIEVGGDQSERIMVPVARRRARPEIMGEPHGALAAHILVG